MNGDKPLWKSTTALGGVIVLGASTWMLQVGKIDAVTWVSIVGSVTIMLGVRNAVNRGNNNGVKVLAVLLGGALLASPAEADLERDQNIWVGANFAEVLLPMLGEDGNVGARVLPMLGISWTDVGSDGERGDFGVWLGGTFNFNAITGGAGPNWLELGGGVSAFNYVSTGVTYRLSQATTPVLIPGSDTPARQVIPGLDGSLRFVGSLGAASEDLE